MKTAVQELFSKLEIEHPNLFNTNTIEGRQFVNDYYQFFEMEKQQIIDCGNSCAFKQVIHNRKVDLMNLEQLEEFALEENLTFGEEYYNETFKNEK